MDRVSFAAFSVLLLAACSAQPASSPNDSPMPSLTAAVSVETRPIPSATATPAPFGAAVFEDPDSCTNGAAGYRVAFPDDWYEERRDVLERMVRTMRLGADGMDAPA